MPRGGRPSKANAAGLAARRSPPPRVRAPGQRGRSDAGDGCVDQFGRGGAYRFGVP
ncbi:hypothetical protein BURPS305_5518 [Burkholderia pseudomallei 305]|nr:hypothetical protein BURPS305_5518 [Burkholderia pseudomallei 305]